MLRPIITVEDLLSELFEIPVRTSSTSGAKVPIHDVIVNDKEYIIDMMLAGIKKEDISIDVENNVLTIKAERKETKDLKYKRKESYYGKYQKSYELPDNVDAEKIEATMENGMLKIVVPKIEGKNKSEKKAIEIK